MKSLSQLLKVNYKIDNTLISTTMNIPLPILSTILGFIFSTMSILIGILIKALNKNTSAIQEMKITLVKQETADCYEEKACVYKHDYITKKLGTLSDMAQSHEIRITKLEPK